MKKTISLTFLYTLFLGFSIFFITGCDLGDSTTSETYTVTWMNHDGTLLEIDNNVAYGTIPTYNGATPEKTCDNQYIWIFDGWSPNVSAVIDDVTYTAQFIDGYTVTFDSNGGNDISSQHVLIGQYVAKPTDPIRTGYSFQGWYLNDEPWSFMEDSVTSATTLTAKWTISLCYLNLDNDETEGTVTGSGVYNYGSSVIITATPNEGCFFDGWYQGSRRISTDEEMTVTIEDSTISFKAKYIRVESIYNNTFYYTQDVDSITITKLKDDSITNLVVPKMLYGKKVVSIQKGAFKSGTNLVSITLPFIGDGVNRHTNFGYIFGAASYADNSSCVPASLKEVIIEDGAIDKSAFYNCSNLTSITISGAVSSIAEDSFYGCTGLTSLIVEPDTSSRFDSRGNCNAIIETSTNTLIVGCKTTVIPSTITSIGDSAFAGCSGLTSLTIPANVESIGMQVLYGCSGLTSITVDPSNTVFDSRGNCNAIIETATNTLVNGCESTVIPGSITTIGESAFVRCNGLTSITIPDSVRTIEAKAFYQCGNLASITIPNNLTTIEDFAFSQCTSLSLVTFSNNLTTIGDFAFSECINLSSITIPNNLTTIGDLAFSGCRGLTSITIPANVESIGYNTFSRCDSLASIIVNPSNTVFDSRDNCNALIETATNLLIKGCKTTVIPDNVVSIGEYAFSGCSGLTSITIPEGVRDIREAAFRNCTDLESITILEGVKYINIAAFSGCSELTSVEIPASVEYFSGAAFYECTNLRSLVVDPLNTVYDSRDNCNAIIITDTNTLVIGCKTTIVPNTVTSIAQYAFYGCSGLTSITIPDAVTSIGDAAFAECSSLTSFTISANVETIGVHAFNGCSGLTSITLPNTVTSVGAYAFNGCSGLTSITLPNAVTSIGVYTFYGCSGLTSITLPNALTTIGSYAFDGCSSLTSITLPDALTRIDAYAFSGCIGLTEVCFEKTNGWWYSFSGSEQSGIKIIGLKYSKTSALQLFDTLSGYHWFCIES